LAMKVTLGLYPQLVKPCDPQHVKTRGIHNMFGSHGLTSCGYNPRVTFIANSRPPNKNGILLEQKGVSIHPNRLLLPRAPFDGLWTSRIHEVLVMDRCTTLVNHVQGGFVVFFDFFEFLF
jgi:hypothetical protein